MYVSLTRSSFWLVAETKIANRLVNASPRTSLGYIRPSARNSRSQISALAILLPERTYATETSTHGSDGGNFPPPGFDSKEAQKPLPKDESSSKTKADPQILDGAQKMHADGSTAEAKTKALENASLTELASGKAAAAKAEEKKLAEKKEEPKKLTIGQKVKKELQHYWDGTKLLATEVRISSKLALKMAAGYELSRRENRQVGNTHFF